MTDADILRCIEALDKRKPKGGDRKSEEAKSIATGMAIDRRRSSKATAETVGSLEKSLDIASSIMG